MWRLRTLGTLALHAGGALPAGAGVRPRPLALVALVAALRYQGISRDKVMAYLWPERDTDRARNCLKQTLFALRHDLQHDLFLPLRSALRLDPQAIAVDCWEFTSAMEQKDFRTAVGCYGGPFLDGFYLPDHKDFELWVDSERAHLAHCYQTALEELVARAEASGDPVQALEWWRLLAEHDPLSSRIAVGLMRALVRVKDRVGALKYAKLHEQRLREELEVSPDTDERVFVQQLWAQATAGHPGAEGTSRTLPSPRSRPDRISSREH